MDLKNYQPQKEFNKKHLLCLQEYDKDDILQILSLALDLKQKQKAGIPHDLLKGKSLAMIFSKSSTRTRVSFEVGMHQLGGTPLFLSSNDIQLGRGESIYDTAQVLSRMVDGIMIRTFLQSDVEGLAKHGTIPVINGLTDDYHPCQILADLLTIYEHKNALSGLKLAFLGDGNNVAHSLLIGCSKLGMDVAIGSPKGYEPHSNIVEWAKANAKVEGSSVVVTTDPIEAIADADVVYTDVWASMGQEMQRTEKHKHFTQYQVNSALFAKAKADAIFLHCLPAHRGEEVTADVIDSPQSVIFDEAENRLHAQKAVMALLMK
ncbi:ornithine carbamoyltransferase [Clostridia bacterium OttesenSCG-928-F22]|nr:ornithine carbamoyltransferase [Clostridia bacterium OttesenSCG-928-F22]